MDRSYVQRFGVSMAEAPDGEGFVAFDAVGGSHRLNGSALFILDCCGEPRTPAAIAAEVQRAYELPEAPLDEVERAIGDLVDLGLVVDATTEPPRGPQPRSPDLEVRASPAVGRGVFARRAFAPGEVVERCPVIVLGGEDFSAVQRTDLGRYTFGWGEGRTAVVLGFGSLYNHSGEPNVGYRTVEHELVMEYVALVPIEAGQEILINYGDVGTSHGFTPLPST